jgi:hypothetical protein
MSSLDFNELIFLIWLFSLDRNPNLFQKGIAFYFNK